MSKHSTGAGFVKKEKDSSGNVHPEGSNNGSTGTVTEEMSESEIREKRVLGKKDDLVVDELSEGGKVRERDSDEHAVKIKIDSLEAQDRLNKWFDTEELSAMQEGRDLIEGRESPDYDKTWKEALKEEVEAKNRELAREKKQEEIEAAREEMRKYTKYDTPVNELDGGDFQELIREANGEGSTDPEGFEEVKQKIEEKYEPMISGDSDTEINNPNLGEEELAELEEAWGEYGGVWEEFSGDFSDSNSDTEYLTISENSRKVKTRDNELRAAILNHEEEPFDGEVEIHEYDRSTNTVTATIPKEN